MTTLPPYSQLDVESSMSVLEANADLSSKERNAKYRLDWMRFRLNAYADASRLEAIQALERGGAKLGPSK